MTESKIRAKLAEEMMKFSSLRKAAEAWNLTPSYISDVMRERRGISNHLAGIVGYRRIDNPPTFVKIGDK